MSYPQHRAVVDGFTRFNAKCGCGWFGPTRNGRDWAQADADHHNLTAVTTPPTSPIRPTPQAGRTGFLS